MRAHDRPRRSPRVVWRRGDEGVVLLDPDDGRYYALDDVGGRIWELCDERRSVAEIGAELAREYDADAPVIEADALELLQELEREGLVAAA
jgi:coenzyme PQQ biosynthesis protein PqqD